MTTPSRSRCPSWTRSLLRAARQRLPADPPGLQAAFPTTEDNPAVPLAELEPDTSYLFDEVTARAFADAVLELAASRPGGRLALICPDPGEIWSLEHRLQHLAGRFDQTLVLGREPPRAAAQTTRLAFHSLAGTPLTRYRLALRSGGRPVAFVAREAALPRRAHPCRVGFFTFDLETVGDLEEDIDQACHQRRADLTSFRDRERQGRQAAQLARSIGACARRVETALQDARSRPGRLTPERLERILRQALEQLTGLRG